MERLIECPVCGDKPGRHHKHCYINVDKGVYYCQLCGDKGSLKDLARKYPAIGRMFDFWLVTSPPQKNTKATEFASDIWSYRNHPIASRVISYLLRRGLSQEELKEVFWSRDMPTRAIFPCFEKGAMVFWVGRSFTDGEMKYRFPKNGETKYTRREAVFGLNWFEGRKVRELWIVEGVFDAYAVGCGVAIMGKTASDHQLRKILSLRPEKLVIALDNDAKQEAEYLYNKVKGVIDSELVFPPSEIKDWGEMLERRI